ncbi:MAG: hypothetical protein ACOYVD_01360 [Bacillota bacterium]
MVDKKCKGCSKFLSNDCTGLGEVNASECRNKLSSQEKEVDVAGCC